MCGLPADWLSFSLRDAILFTLGASWRDALTLSSLQILEKIQKTFCSTAKKKDVNKALYEDLLVKGAVLNTSPSNTRPYWSLSAPIKTRLAKYTREASGDPPSEEDSRKDYEKKPEQAHDWEYDTGVFIDLGNVHDCLLPAADLHQNILREGDEDGFELRAYADYTCNTPGVKEHMGSYVVKAMTSRSNAADVHMILDIADYLQKNPRATVLIASNDNILSTFGEIMQLRHPESSISVLQGSKCWSKLRLFLN